MNIEPYWGVLIGLGIGGLIKVVFFSGRKASKAAATGQCGVCGSTLVDKPFTTVTLKVCPQKHGYLAGGGQWVESAYIEKATRKYRDNALEDVPQPLILYWTMYHLLFGPDPVAGTTVDNVPGRKRRVSKPPEVATAFCTACGAKLEQNAKFCESCGAPAED